MTALSAVPKRDQTIALAGVFQAALTTRRLAREGTADDAALRASARSILITDAISTEAIFGGAMGVMEGLLAIRNKMHRRLDAADMEIARYMFAMTKLRERLLESERAVEILGAGIARLGNTCGRLSQAELYSELADLYRGTISTLQPRIMVQGEQALLADPRIVCQVRTALLAGVRAAILWHQLGGRRRHLVLYRRGYRQQAEQILANVSDTRLPNETRP